MHRSLLATRAAIPPFFCNPLFNCLDLVRYNHIQVKGLMAGRSVVSVGINGSGAGAGAQQTRKKRGKSGAGAGAGGQVGRQAGKRVQAREGPLAAQAAHDFSGVWVSPRQGRRATTQTTSADRTPGCLRGLCPAAAHTCSGSRRSREPCRHPAADAPGPLAKHPATRVLRTA